MIPQYSEAREHIEEMKEEVIELKQRVSFLENEIEKISSAFVNNDLGKPDYDGHRKSHIVINQASENMEGYKNYTVKNVIKIALSFISGILVLGIGTWIKNISGN